VTIVVSRSPGAPDHRRVEGRARQPVADERHTQVVHGGLTLDQVLRPAHASAAFGLGAGE
jgi:hypothetical protein